jgi:hypothetical protein
VFPNLHRVRAFALAAALAGLLAVPAAAAATPPWYTEVIHSAGFVGDYIRLAVDHRGTPHVIYWDLNNFFAMYATRVNGAWTTEVIQASVFLGTDLDIAVDAQDVPHVTFHIFTAGSDELRYGVRTGGGWTVEDVDPGNNDVGKYNSIAIDSQGRPHVVYWDETATDLKYAVKNGAWSIETAVGGSDFGRFADLALDTADRPHVVYYWDSQGRARYHTKIGSSWIGYAVDLADADYIGVALDPAGTPAILTHSGGYLNVYTRETGLFASPGAYSSTADTDGALVYDKDGVLHAFYQDVDVGLGELYYLQVENGTATTSPVILTGSAIDTGDKNDIAVDPYGNPLGVFYDATNGDAWFVDSGVRLSTGLSAATWPVGSERTVAWRGGGPVDLLLSTDGGASYQTLASGLAGTGNGGGTYTFTVPHRPSRFCKVKLERETPYAASLSDSLFTIEASVALLNMAVIYPNDAGGAMVTWATNPGPEDLAGYRVDRRRDAGAWTTVEALVTTTTYHDADGRRGDEYRLFAVNGLGHELLLGSARGEGSPSATVLDAFPNPLRHGSLTVLFATAGGLGGAPGKATVGVYDVAGRRVRTLADGAYTAGVQRATWDGRNARGEPVSSGVYFVRSVTGGETYTRKVLVVR